MSVDSLYENMWAIVVFRESQTLLAHWPRPFTALPGRKWGCFLVMITFLVDWCQVLSDLLAHQCPFSSSTCCHSWSLSDLVLEGSWLIIKPHYCCFLRVLFLTSGSHRLSPSDPIDRLLILSSLPEPWFPALPLRDWLAFIYRPLRLPRTLGPSYKYEATSCSLSIITPADWHWVGHAIAATFVPPTWPWAWGETLTLFSWVQASALCCSPGHQVGPVLPLAGTPALPGCFLKASLPAFETKARRARKGSSPVGTPVLWSPLVMLS